MSHPPAPQTAPRLVASVSQPPPARNATSTRRAKSERNAATAAGTQVTQTAPVAEVRADSIRTGTPRRDPTRNPDARRADGRRDRSRKEKLRDGDPDPGGDSEDSEDSRSDSEDASSEDSEPGEVMNLTTATQGQAGTTLLTLRPFINSNTLGEFDPRATLRERVHWWERIANMASQGGWTTKTRIQELKLKLLVSARDWFNQFPRSVS
ncbi:hypothetical protein V7S43_015485 [Phytophthora oleae]|uniref:Uncharacterized protein n=1 Tax=Phytophthora oleae TaxID=2107226 RepID=A0ABD3F2Z4_9STRA